MLVKFGKGDVAVTVVLLEDLSRKMLLIEPGHGKGTVGEVIEERTNIWISPEQLKEFEEEALVLEFENQASLGVVIGKLWELFQCFGGGVKLPKLKEDSCDRKE